MVENFAPITDPLTQSELDLVEPIAAGLARRTEANPIKGADICAAINAKYELKFKFEESRLRKIINYIRCKGILPVIATSRGYYTAQTVEEIRSQIASLRDRAAGINAAADGLLVFVKEPNLFTNQN